MVRAMNVNGFIALRPARLGVVLLFFFLQQIRDFDVWFYMVVGREAVARGALQDTIRNKTG